MADGHGSGHALSCQVCGGLFNQASGRGRPRKRCESCSPPRPGQKQYGDRTCIECGTAIKRGTRLRACSPECREARRVRLETARARANGVRHRRRAQARTCAHCGISFIRPNSPSRDVGLYCGRPCSFAAMRARRLAKEALRPPKPVPISCVICGTLCAKANQKYCGHECRAVASRRCAKALWVEQNPFKERECCGCGRVFVPMVRKHGLQSFCSGLCRGRVERENRRTYRRARRARERALSGDWFDPLGVLRRDGWRCYLCGKDTPEKLRGSYHPDAPELDHVIPISKGGAHTTANTRCACRACNSAKSDRLIAA